jgi:membrane protease YdiL (CAAX protease family)
MYKKHKDIALILICSLLPCVLYSVLLITKYNTYWLTSISKIFLFTAFPLLYFYKRQNLKIKDIWEPGGNKKYIIISAWLGFGTFCIIISAFVFLRFMFDDTMILNALAKEGITKKNFIMVFINIIFINAFIEELYFRGFVFNVLRRMKFKKFAYIYSAVLFSLYHALMIQNWFLPGIFIICMAGLVIGGLLFNRLYEKCGGLLGGYLIHAGANLGINLIGLYLFLTN